MDDLTPKQRIDAFEARHGGKENSIYDGVWIYFEDGARREGNPLGALCEPPTDPRQLQKNIVRYHTFLLDRHIRAFDDRKRELVADPGAYNDAEKNLAELKALQVAVRKQRNKVVKAEEVLHRLTPGYRTPEEEAATIARESAIEASKATYLSALAEIDA